MFRTIYRIMAVTRSKVSTTVVESIPLEPVKKKVKLTPKREKLTVKPPSLDRKVTDLELHLTHIDVPKSLELPKEFVEKHTSTFIDGCHGLLKIDPTLYRVIVCKDFPHYFKSKGTETSPYEDNLIISYWYALVSLIISQQVSGAAAKSIESKFRALFDGEPTPEATLKISSEALRGAGLLNKKVEYVQGLSDHFLNPENELSKFEFYENNPEDVIIDKLVELKGIGPWSAKMFLTFTLEKNNVFAHDDLGVARGAYRYLLRRHQFLDQIKKSCKESEELQKLLQRKSKFAVSKGKRDWTPHHDVYVQQLGKLFDPYQTIFMLLLWRLSATNVDVLEGNTNNKNPN